MAPKWMIASSLRPSSQLDSSAGGTISASWRLARLRHLPLSPSTSHIATSLRPASFNAATRFDPIKPAPPVTSNIDNPALISAASFAPLLPARQHGQPGVVKQGVLIFGRRSDFTCRQGADTDKCCIGRNERMTTHSLYQELQQDVVDTRPILVVPYMWIG